MAKTWKPVNCKFKNYKLKIIEATKILEQNKDAIQSKVVAVQVPKFDCITGNSANGTTKTLDRPLYAVDESEGDYLEGTGTGGTCYDLDIFDKLKEFKGLPEDKTIKCTIRISIPLYDRLKAENIIE